jgi:hypothetical protein
MLVATQFQSKYSEILSRVLVPARVCAADGWGGMRDSRPQQSADAGDAGRRAGGRDAEGTRSLGAGGAAGLFAPAPVRGALGFSGRRVLLPGARGGVHATGESRVGEQSPRPDWRSHARRGTRRSRRSTKRGRSKRGPRACRNPRKRHSPPWTANGTGSSRAATTRWRRRTVIAWNGRSADRS